MNNLDLNSIFSKLGHYINLLNLTNKVKNTFLTIHVNT